MRWGGFARTLSRGGDVCLVEGGPWWGRKELRCRGFGNTLTCCDRDELKKGCDRWCLLVPALLKLHVCAEVGSKFFGYVSCA